MDLSGSCYDLYAWCQITIILGAIIIGYSSHHHLGKIEVLCRVIMSCVIMCYHELCPACVGSSSAGYWKRGWVALHVGFMDTTAAHPENKRKQLRREEMSHEQGSLGTSSDVWQWRQACTLTSTATLSHSQVAWFGWSKLKIIMIGHFISFSSSVFPNGKWESGKRKNVQRKAYLLP